MEAFGIFSTCFFGYALYRTVKSIFTDCYSSDYQLECDVEDYVCRRNELNCQIKLVDDELNRLHDFKKTLAEEKEEIRTEINKQILDKVLEISVVKKKLESKFSKLFNEEIKIEEEDVRSAIDEKITKILQKYSDEDVDELVGIIKSGTAMNLLQNPEYDEKFEDCSLTDAKEEAKVLDV